MHRQMRDTEACEKKWVVRFVPCSVSNATLLQVRKGLEEVPTDCALEDFPVHLLVWLESEAGASICGQIVDLNRTCTRRLLNCSRIP
jgi:hypothetical protein